MTRKIKNKILQIVNKFRQEEQKILLLLGQHKAAAVRNEQDVASLSAVEFRIFSQYGEDGIIQYIVSKIDIPNKIFIEFGVENYTEANTRFLLINDNWSGMVIDGDESNINYIKSDTISWRNDITAVHSFITRENINTLIGAYTQQEDIGILSVDIDGNDYWVLKNITTVKPRILICEYNNAFGPDHSITVPYSANFVRRNAHHSNLYFGASLRAIYNLANEKGYDFVGVNSTNINAFFVRKDLSAPFRKYKPEDVYVPSKNRESMDEKGNLTFLSGNKRIEAIKEMMVFETVSNQEITIAKLFNL